MARTTRSMRSRAPTTTPAMSPVFCVDLLLVELGELGEPFLVHIPFLFRTKPSTMLQTHFLLVLSKINPFYLSQTH